MNRTVTNPWRTRTAFVACLLSFNLSIAAPANLALGFEYGSAATAGGLSKADRSLMTGEALAPMAPAAIINVDTTVDEDDTNPANCSLREAIVAANNDAAFGGCGAGSGDDTITFTVTGTITLTSALPDLSTSMAIAGPAASQLTVSGDNSVRVFKVTLASPGTVSFSGLTISDGQATMDVGGGLYNESSATINVSDSTISNNSAVLGGGLANSSVGIFTLTNSTVRDNSAGTAGGIYNGQGTFNLINSTLNNNSADTGGSGNGGGINTGSGTLNVTNSTLSENTAANDGGGIFNSGTDSSVNVTSSTVTGNSAASGGGINSPFGGVPLIRDSIIALNTASVGGPDLSGTFTTQSYNLIGNNDSVSSTFPAGNPNANNDLVGTTATPLDPLLGPLAHNGGPTQTHRLLTGSPAIDKGKNFATDESSNPILTDQRGLLRPVDLDDPPYPNATGGDASDIGAYELQGDTVQTGTPSLIVNTPDDHDDGSCTDGDCTLREAIIAANSDSDPSTITFDLPGAGPHIIQLTGYLDDLETEMNIEGPTNEPVQVRGESIFNPYSIFTVAPVAVVNISNLTISDGAEFAGGGILNCGSLTVNHSAFTGNFADFGGAISSCGSLTVNNSTFTENFAEFGGAIDNLGSLNIKDSTFADNLAVIGGAIYNEGILNIEGSTLTGNHAFVEGGAIGTDDGFLIMVNTTISGNSSDGAGGGLLHCGGTTGFLTNVTITNNRADADGNDEGEGFDVGGGISQISDFPITLRNTIVAGNFTGESPSTTPDDLDGPMDPESSFNLIGLGGSGGLVDRSVDPVHGNQVGVVNPGLGPLQDNGGPTFTHALLVGSPAINAAVNMTSLSVDIDADDDPIDVVDAGGIPNCVGFTIRIDDEQMIVNCKAGNTLSVTRGANGTTAVAHSAGANVNPPFDQRGPGFPRVVFTSGDTSLDVGAFEVQGASPTISTQASAGGVVGTQVNDVATLAGGNAATGTVTFRLFSDTECSNQVFTSTNPVSGGTTATSDNFMPTAPGTYYWSAVYSGDNNNNGATSPCDADDESVTIIKASPTISTQASAGGVIGTQVNDVATVAGGYQPTGTVTFRLFSDSECANQVFTSTNALSGGTSTSDNFSPGSPGTYYWTAVYSGDANNNSATSPCGAPNESVTIAGLPDLTITKTHAGNFSSGQVGATYTITVSNAGSGPTDGSTVTVTDNVPTGLTPTGPVGIHNGWFCSIVSQTLTCQRSDALAGNSSYPTITLTVNVANPAPLTVTNTATVSGGGDSDSTNNSASDLTNINCETDPSQTNNNPLMISRFRMNGPGGAQDEFVEVFNPTDEEYTVASGNCTGGLAVFASAGNGTTSNGVNMVCQIPNGTLIPARGYFLCTGATYSLRNLGLNGGAAGANSIGDAPIGCDGTCLGDIPDDAGLALLDVGANIVSLCPKGAFGCPTGFSYSSPSLGGNARVYDSVGFSPYGPGSPISGYPSLAPNFCEGQCLKPVGDASIDPTCAENALFPVISEPPVCYGQAGQYEFLRRQTTFDASVGTLHQDTNSNANDVLLVAPNPGVNMGLAITGVSGVSAMHGAAGPQDRSAPADFPKVDFPQAPFDGVNQLGPRNAERDYNSDPTITNPNNDPLGTFVLRLRFTNNSGENVSGVRFRIDNLSTLCGPQSALTVGTGDARNLSASPDCVPAGFTAILKLLNSTKEVVVDSSNTAQTVNGTVIEDLSAAATPTPPDTPPNFLSPFAGGVDNSVVVNPSSATSTVGDGAVGGTGEFSTFISNGSVIRIRLKFGVVKSGRFILLVTPAARSGEISQERLKSIGAQN